MDRLEIVVVDIQTDDLFRGRRGGPAAQKPAIFCAYRMTSPQSLQMRHDLESRLDAATNVFVLDGRVADGEPWASTIRDRIKRSRLVVADVSGPSREVLFELGFARNKALVTIVETDQHRERLPRWLPSFQMSAYSG